MLMGIYRVAEKFKISPVEVMGFSPQMYSECLAYIKITNKEIADSSK